MLPHHEAASARRSVAVVRGGSNVTTDQRRLGRGANSLTTNPSHSLDPADVQSDRPTVRVLGTHGVPANYGGFETAAEKVGLHLSAAGRRVIVYCQRPGEARIIHGEWRGLKRDNAPVDLGMSYAPQVRQRRRSAGFITMNLPMLAPVLKQLSIPSPLICSSINKIGFRMPGAIDQYRKALESHGFRPVAMSVYASGAIPPDEAIPWVCEQPNIESIVFGASSRRNIRGTNALVDKYWPK